MLTEYMHEVPFRHVFHGIIRDKQGRKMSKSRELPDPLDMIARGGQTACAYVTHAPQDRTLLMSKTNR
jgi:valyl-tRNA synthetase